MADQVEEIKQKINIVDIIGERLNLKKAGRNYKANCPFHGEKMPSFMVSPTIQIFKCFGCGKSGDVFSFLQEFEGMDFSEALRYLAQRTGVKLQHFDHKTTDQNELYFTINRMIASFYHYVLLSHPAGRPGLNYLTRERGIKLDTINKFQLGFAPVISRHLIEYLTKKKKFNPQDIISAGLAYPTSQGLKDRFAGRVIFPLFDHRDNTLGFAGRLLPENDNGRSGKYINSPDSAVYHKSKILYGLNLSKEKIRTEGRVVIMEGELDLISSWQAGICNTVAIKGSALTSDQIDLLRRYTDEIVLNLDSDLAGDMAARRGIMAAFEKGMEVKVARLVGYKDPDEAARSNPQLLKDSLARAVSVWEYLIDAVFAKYDSKTSLGKSRISREIVPILASIEDKIMQAHFIGIVAGRLDVPASAVEAESQKAVPEFKPAAKTDLLKILPAEKSRRERLEEKLLSLAFRFDPKDHLSKDEAVLFSAGLTEKIYRAYWIFSRKNKTFDLSEFAKSLPPEIFPGFSEMILNDNYSDEEDSVQLVKELELIKNELRLIDIREKLTDLTKRMKEAETAGDEKALTAVKAEFTKLSGSLKTI